MSKNNDGPTIAMKVEHGRLVPASAFDLELLGRWHEGTVLNVDVARPYVRPLEKKYFAMLSHLIREADTPWSNTESAHEAIKLATGFVAPFKRKNGTWGANARSIATFTDGELSEFVELFQGIVRKRFGIDPETLQREAHDTGSSGTPSNGRADDDPGASPIPAGVGVQFTRSSPIPGDVPEAGGTLESTPRDVPSARGPNLRQEEWDWLKLVARMLVSATEPGGDTGIVDRQVSLIKEHYTPESISPEAKEKATMIYRHCRAVTKGKRPLDRKWVTHVAGCVVADLRAEAR